MEKVRIYEIPECKMVSSKCGMFGEPALDDFDNWFSSLPVTTFPQDFLWFDKNQGGFIWYYIYHEALKVPDTFDIIDFPGGLYAVATGIDGESNDEVMNSIRTFIQEKSCFKEDISRPQLGNIITPKSAQQALGYSQMDYYVPIKTILK